MKTCCSLCGGGGGLLLAAAIVFFSCCTSRREMVERKSFDSIAVTSVKADHIATEIAEWESVREIIVMHIDSVGNLRPIKRVIDKTQGKTVERTVENVEKIDSVGFYSQSEVITREKTENTIQGKKNGVLEKCIFFMIVLAVFGFFILFLWHKFTKK